MAEEAQNTAARLSGSLALTRPAPTFADRASPAAPCPLAPRGRDTAPACPFVAGAWPAVARPNPGWHQRSSWAWQPRRACPPHPSACGTAKRGFASRLATEVSRAALVRAPLSASRAPLRRRQRRGIARATLLQSGGRRAQIRGARKRLRASARLSFHALHASTGSPAPGCEYAVNRRRSAGAMAAVHCARTHALCRRAFLHVDVDHVAGAACRESPCPATDGHVFAKAAGRPRGGGPPRNGRDAESRAGADGKNGDRRSRPHGSRMPLPAAAALARGREMHSPAPPQSEGAWRPGFMPRASDTPCGPRQAPRPTAHVKSALAESTSA